MERITISCINDGKTYEMPLGERLSTVAPAQVTNPLTGRQYPVLAALVDHELKALDFQVFFPHKVEFIGYDNPEGRRTYLRSLSFLLQRAVRSLFPDKVLKINHSLPSGLYCKFRGETIADEDILRLREEMRRLVALDLPFIRKKLLSEEASAIFRAQRQPLKAALQESLGRYFCSVYYLDGVADNFYGPLVPSTGYLKVFDLMPFHHGFCLQYPSDDDITRTIARQKQKKLTVTLKEYGYWCKATGVVSVSALNSRLLRGRKPHQSLRSPPGTSLRRVGRQSLRCARPCEDCLPGRSVFQRKNLVVPASGPAVHREGDESEGHRTGQLFRLPGEDAQR